jgi:tRNA 2-thiouridine synthesizing protein A
MRRTASGSGGSTFPDTACQMVPMSSLLNLRGLKCPLPALRTRKALKSVAAGGVLVVECTDPMAAIDIPNLIRETGDVLDAQETRDDVLVFHIRRAGAPA